MSRRYTSTPLDLRTEDPRPGLCRYCGEPLPSRRPKRGRPPVTCSPLCKRLYTNRQKWAARIQLARRESRLTHDRSDGALPWAASYDDVASYDDDADASTMEGYGLVYGDLDLLHGAKLKKTVHAFEEARAEVNLKAELHELEMYLAETGQTLEDYLVEIGYYCECPDPAPAPTE